MHLEEGNITLCGVPTKQNAARSFKRILDFEDWIGVTGLQQGLNRDDIIAALVSIETEIRAQVTPAQDLPNRIDMSIQQALRFGMRRVP